MRARAPDHAGYAVNDGVRIYYEVHGHGVPPVLLVPAYQIVHSRIWKMQVPFLARHFQTIVYDPRGNGQSDRPPAAYGLDALVADAVAVADEARLDRFAIVTISAGVRPAVSLAARYPHRVTRMVFIGGSLHPQASVTAAAAWQELRAWMLDSFDDYVRDFFATAFPESHSTKPRDDGWDYAHDTDARTLVDTGEHGWGRINAREAVSGVRCPVLVIHGTKDGRVPYPWAEELCRLLPQGRLVTVRDGGHLPNVRDSVRVNLLIRTFLTGG